ncbi:single-stranded DNA-binding protein [Candidatus Falkowbacteria bacterium]|nr:single-stranded DNA-binding protein [Candidatus Falkowbacteria bacterium]
MNLNKAIIIGNLTQNPEVRTTANGTTVASFTVASNRVWTDQQGQKQEQAEFHNVVAWGRLAEIVGQYLAKGRLCMVEGRIQTRNWDDQSGNRHWKTEIIVENIQLGPRPNQGQGGSFETERSQSAGESAAPAFPPAPANNVKEKEDEEEIKIEDIPF